MSGLDLTPQSMTVGILTVGLDAAASSQLYSALAAKPWAIARNDFESYMSAERRPNLSLTVRSAQACMALINFDRDVEAATETAVYLGQMFAGRISLVAVSAEQTQDILLRGMRSGCTEFLPSELNGADVEAALARFEERWLRSSVRTYSSGSILSFFGAKGGVGATTVAVHLGTYLAEAQKKVLLIDNKPELGHVSIYLGLDGSRYHFHELLRNVDRLDSDLLRGFLAKHPSGMDVLSSPDSCGAGMPTDPYALSRTLEFLRSESDFVLVDGATSLGEDSMTVIEASNFIYLIATPEIGAIRDLSRYIDALIQRERTTDKMRVVINRCSSRYAVEVEQIEKAIRLPVSVRLPNSYTDLVKAVNLGEPVPAKRKSEFTLQFTKWVEQLAGPVKAHAEESRPAKPKASVLPFFSRAAKHA
jgi:pilus assembly protein CpaE